MEILIITSLIAAFIAGIAALFAPCCVTVLLPSYLGSVFRQRRTVLLMTLVFFLGIFAVFLPLGLGIAAVGQIFRQFHVSLYASGGLFLIFLGLFILSGKHFSLPFSFSRPRREGDGTIEGAWSVFMLGIFSGFATLCCAPVLAGVLALSALPGSMWWGGLYALAYAFGMVSPLFLLAYFLDRADWKQRIAIFKRRIAYSFLGIKANVALADLIAGTVYLAMGTLIIALALTDRLAMGGGSSAYATSVNIAVAKAMEFISRILGM